MTLAYFLNKDITVGNTPPLGPGDEQYYPEEGVTFQLASLYGDICRFAVVAPDVNEALFPNFWDGSILQMLRAGPSIDPASQHQNADRFYGVVYLFDRFFHVWFVDTSGTQQGPLECFTLATQSLNGEHLKEGGYKTGGPN